MTTFLSTRRGLLLTALLYTFLWGSAFPLIKVCFSALNVADDLSKCLVAGIRFTLSGGVLSLLVLKEEKRACPNKDECKPVLLYGLLGTSVQYAFTFIGMSRVEGATGAIFDQLCVFFIILLGGLFLKNESLTRWKILGCVLGFAGVMLVSTEPMGFSFSLMGEGMMILAALTQTAAYFIAAKAANAISTMRLVGNGQLVGGLVLTLFSITLGGTIPRISLGGVFALLGLSFISATAYVLSLLPLKYFSPSQVSVYNLLIPVFGVIMSGLVLGENVLRLNYLGALILISLGIFTVNYGGRRRGTSL